MFLPWLGIYLAVVMYTENKRMRRLQALSMKPEDASPAGTKHEAKSGPS
jgi:hypothetical protein